MCVISRWINISCNKNPNQPWHLYNLFRVPPNRYHACKKKLRSLLYLSCYCCMACSLVRPRTIRTVQYCIVFFRNCLQLAIYVSLYSKIGSSGCVVTKEGAEVLVPEPDPVRICHFVSNLHRWSSGKHIIGQVALFIFLIICSKFKLLKSTTTSWQYLHFMSTI